MPLLGIVSPALLASAAMGAIVLAAGSVLNALAGPMELAVLIAIGAATYPLFIFAVAPADARRLFTDLRLMVRRSSQTAPSEAASA